MTPAKFGPLLCCRSTLPAEDEQIKDIHCLIDGILSVIEGKFCLPNVWSYAVGVKRKIIALPMLVFVNWFLQLSVILTV
jgi:hypothetical protein